MSGVTIARPTQKMVQLYLDQWDKLENYVLQESSLNKLFTDTYPFNTDINEVLIKASSLNDFYSTNIYSIFPVAKRIQALGIDNRLRAGDTSLVNDIAENDVGGKKKYLYSFATKYCSHHNPLEYPIYDSYVDRVLRYFRKKDRFLSFKNDDLKSYPNFKEILLSFRCYYELDRYSLKDLDKYLWLLGKESFPRNYK